MLVFPSPSLSLDPLFLFVCPVGVTWCCCVNPCGPFKVLVLPSRKMPLSMYLCTLSVLGSTTVTTLLGFAITVIIEKYEEKSRKERDSFEKEILGLEKRVQGSLRAEMDHLEQNLGSCLIEIENLEKNSANNNQ